MFEWLQAHWDELLTLISSVVVIISLIVKWTKTEKDDAIWAKIRKVLVALSLISEEGPKVK